MGCEISTCQMQYDANNKETDQKDPCFIYSGVNGPRKCLKHQVSWGCDGIHVSSICTKANRTFNFLRRNLYSCRQEVKAAAYKGLEYSGSVLFGTPQV